MAKTITEIRSLARSHTRTAINVLVRIMRSKDATAAARVTAANAILDRGWGKATQPLESGDDGALELIHRIERVIVHPENPDSYLLYRPRNPWAWPNTLCIGARQSGESRTEGSPSTKSWMGHELPRASISPNSPGGLTAAGLFFVYGRCASMAGGVTNP
jgi:hypothetical protein